MFAQVVQGQVMDKAALKAAAERWVTGLAPGAQGWLGTTSGVTDDGTFVAVVRFASEADARRNSDRPEQHQWWMETSKLLAGEATFHDCPEVVEWMGGGSDEAGFVQVMQGRVADRDRWVRTMETSEDALRSFRPDVIGGTVAFATDGTVTQTVYFTSEAEARQAETKQPPPELAAALEEDMSLFTDVTYLDLRDPWLDSPR